MGERNVREVKKFCVGEVKNTMEPEEGFQFLEATEYHGDRDEVWIEIYNKEGKLMGRWNMRFVIGVEYA
jgi:hypothetical protein